MATVPIQNAPRNLTMQDFRSINDMYGSLQKSCRFIVQVIPTGEYVRTNVAFLRDLMYLCEAAEFPGRNFESVDVRYYGPNHKLPHKTVYEDINITFVCRNGSLERQFFDNWQLIINPPNTWDFNYRDQYRSIVNLYQYDDYSRPLLAEYPMGTTAFSKFPLQSQVQGAPDNPGFIAPPYYNNGPTAQYLMSLYDAYPININTQPVTWADDQFQRLIVTFTYSHWTRPGLDPKPRSDAGGGFSYNLVTGSSVFR